MIRIIRFGNRMMNLIEMLETEGEMVFFEIKEFLLKKMI